MSSALGFVGDLLERNTEKFLKKVINLSKDEWEKFKIDFDFAFTKYLKKSYEKYSKVKTVLYRTEPKDLYNFFEVPNLIKGRDEVVDAADVNNLLDISNFLIIQGSGGIGKSIFMKHMFINELEKKDLIPILIELKDINDAGSNSIQDFIFEKLYNFSNEVDKKYIEYALKTGCFLFLFDGYDEIVSEKKTDFYKELTGFCDRYSDNYFIVSSRPYSEFVEFQRFTVLSLRPFTKEQAISLIKKIEFDEAIKINFCKALDEELYDKHQSFASNPLLLNIMLLTYDNYAEIPEKLHLFYSNAFDTLYSKHDATKGGYKRELKSQLPIDSSKKVFAQFCFMTYYNGKIEFTYDELVSTFGKIKKLPAAPKDIINDLTDSVCVLCKDGLTYRFTHRSFQEFFCAVFLKELSDEFLEKYGLALIKKDTHRATNDSVFKMLYDMAESRVEQNIFLPLLHFIEEKCDEDKYDFYLKKHAPVISFGYYYEDDEEDDGEIGLAKLTNTGDELVLFIERFCNKYVDYDLTKAGVYKTKLFDYVVQNMDYTLNCMYGDNIYVVNHLDDKAFYDLFKETWVGGVVKTLAKLKETLEKKKVDDELDLDELVVV